MYVDILSLPAMWQFFVARSMISQQITLKFAAFLLILLKNSKAHQSLMTKMLKDVMLDLDFSQILQEIIAQDTFRGTLHKLRSPARALRSKCFQ